MKIDINPEARNLRDALGTFATGVTIVTTRSATGDVGLTANSFASVSLDPPLVLWSLAKRSTSIDAFRKTTHFAIHVLSADQEHLSRRFSTKVEERFADTDVERGPDGIPMFADCLARFICRTAFQYDGGDHVIFIGEVLDFGHSGHAPLVFHRGRYGMFLGREQTSVGPAEAARNAPPPDDLLS